MSYSIIGSDLETVVGQRLHQVLILSAEDFKSEGQDLSMGDPVPFEFRGTLC